MRYAALDGGKRLRPFLVIQGASLFNVSERGALRVAAALELVHCYPLIPDDLPAMEDDDLRPRKPPVHRHYDEAAPSLAGDALLKLAFEAQAHPHTPSNPPISSPIVPAHAEH